MNKILISKNDVQSKRQNIDTKYMNYYTNRAKLKEAFLKNHINLDITITVSIYWDYKKSHEYTDTFKSSQILSERFRNTLDKDGKVKNITFLSKAYAYYADRQFFIMLLNESNGWKIRLIFNAPHSIRYATTTEWFDTQYFPDELSELIGNRDIR